MYFLVVTVRIVPSFLGISPRSADSFLLWAGGFLLVHKLLKEKFVGLN